MALLHVALQEGFEGDRVVVHVNGREVFAKDDVRTMLQIGLADSFDVEVPGGPTKISVEVASRGAAESFDVDVQDQAYAGLSLTREGDLVPAVSREPFGYV